MRHFDLEFVTLDTKRKTGGALKSLRKCRIASASHNIFSHGTINVLHNQSAHEVTIHTRLILKLNGELIHG
jgi:hypothetical protein